MMESWQEGVVGTCGSKRAGTAAAGAASSYSVAHTVRTAPQRNLVGRPRRGVARPKRFRSRPVVAKPGNVASAAVGTAQREIMRVVCSVRTAGGGVEPIGTAASNASLFFHVRVTQVQRVVGREGERSAVA